MNEIPKTLTELLLSHVRPRPGMFLKEPKISNLTTFLVGYMEGLRLAQIDSNRIDDYFGEFGFMEWFYKKYAIKPSSSWQTPFLDEAEGDEKKALTLYFEYLERYQGELLVK